ncbi:Panacea domain-containing protein [Leuconostoc fallax]|uniref:Panacea domain-containing protein n=1 Tax=Leuconostoc fallax TaxID=1251 RepID=UPI001C1E9242|nr:type II toxin-antitoxin system antitoxin SocA domain-containing protein [Leuconostoc fallax]MBU7455857.1 DUF4065 domain-containing protein [Leuconostoc fallax]
MTMMELSEHILAVANENNLSVTNLQLQKVMYFTIEQAKQQKLLSNEDLTNLYDDPFLVWRYGPVVPKIYQKYSVFSASPIMSKSNIHENLKVLQDVIINLLKQNPFDLVNQSHQENFWRLHENEINGWRSDVEYQLDDIGN